MSMVLCAAQQRRWQDGRDAAGKADRRCLDVYFDDTAGFDWKRGRRLGEAEIPGPAGSRRSLRLRAQQDPLASIGRTLALRLIRFIRPHVRRLLQDICGSNLGGLLQQVVEAFQTDQADLAGDKCRPRVVKDRNADDAAPCASQTTDEGGTRSQAAKSQPRNTRQKQQPGADLPP